ncbi:MAG: MMPL family transporter [Gammaproteobacteria bacterium]|nr:MMPL family transporter [Gammaproteobacteria bacterium]
MSALAARPLALLAVVAFLTVAALAQLVDWRTGTLRLSIDPSAEALLTRASTGAAGAAALHGDDPRAVLARARRLFGDEDPVIVAVGFSPGVFTAGNLRQLAEVQTALARVAGVTGVFCLLDAPDPLASADAIDVASFGRQAAAAPQRIPQLEAHLRANPLYAGTLVSNDGRMAALALTLAADSAAPGLMQTLRAAVHRVLPGAPVAVTGGAIVRAATAQAIRQTLAFTVPGVFVLMLVLLLVTFRSLRAALSALTTVLIALIWTLATASRAGLTINLVSALVPPLVVILGLSYTIHLLAAYALSGRLQPQAQGAALRQATMHRILPGIALSALTTIVGFASLALNPLPAVQQFAWLASVGTACLAVLTLLLLPLLLVALGCRRDRPTVGERLFVRLAGWLAAFDRRHRAAILVGTGLLLPLAGWSATHIRTGTDFIASFGADSPVARDFAAINRAFDGANVISVLIETGSRNGAAQPGGGEPGGGDGALAQPRAARAIDELAAWLRRQPEVGAAVSYVDELKLINRSLHDGAASAYAVPDSAAAIKQELVFAGGDTVAHFLDADFSTALMTVRLKIDGSAPIGAFLQRLDARLAALPPPLRAQTTGGTVLATRAVNAIPAGHLQSVLLAIGSIWLLLSLLFTSWRAGALATLPNLVPLAVYFGTLGLFDIRLNPTTSLIACIVLGIAVNDTVHFLARFNADARQQGDEAGAVASALSAVLRPITLATLALSLGLLLFAGSALKSQAQFGLLAAWTLTVAWVADMLLTPALGSRLRIVTLWDLLRLDLGASPQLTIPLLYGLSPRQARVFALLSRLETQPAGARLIRAGDYARDIYVIVDGTLEAWIDRDGARKRLATMGRGVTLGEAGTFGQRRTANVDAVTDVRLLRFDAQDLERLRRRNPRIAAVIFRNLNRIQAERIARMTAMVQ